MCNEQMPLKIYLAHHERNKIINMKETDSMLSKVKLYLFHPYRTRESNALIIKFAPHAIISTPLH